MGSSRKKHSKSRNSRSPKRRRKRSRSRSDSDSSDQTNKYSCKSSRSSRSKRKHSSKTSKKHTYYDDCSDPNDSSDCRYRAGNERTSIGDREQYSTSSKYRSRNSPSEQDTARSKYSSEFHSEKNYCDRGHSSNYSHISSNSTSFKSNQHGHLSSKYQKNYDKHSLRSSSPYHLHANKDGSASYSKASQSSAVNTSPENSSGDSEDEIMFDWEQHRRDLNLIFFQEQDFIRKNSDQYHEFWKFLKKYQAVQRQKTIQNIISKSSSKKNIKNSTSGPSKLNLPSKFNARYFVNFAIKGDSISSLMQRLPPRDDDGKKCSRLTKKKVEEFKNVILLYLNFIQKKNFEKLQKLRRAQSDLPIYQYKQEIIRTVHENSIVLVAGDTGCGKSTQVPQYLMEAGYCNIACTQPRRIACISLSKRVAYETLNDYGTQIGYQIRFERKRTEHTKIVFLTEGLLLRQVSTDASLSSYDVVILDEIHERHLHTDFLLGVMKCLLLRNTKIKVILMSATINIELFSKYFLDKAPVIQVPGRLYPIKVKYFPIPILDQTTKNDKLNPAPFVRVLHLIDTKYKEDERGDVLMFLSGFSEINTVVEAAKLYTQQSKKWVILPLHSNLSVSDQEKVFDVAPYGMRKCIVSTNIAETSITIDGVRFVVDSGKVKEMSYDSVCKMQKLKEFWVSQASAEQRKGRAGRTGPGVCFRLYSKEHYESLEPYTTPEIQRVPLDSLVLQMIAMGLPDVRLFPFIEPPSSDSLEVSVSSLQSQAALTDSEALTTTGRLLSQLPVDVAIGKMLLMGSLFHQAEATLSLAAALSVQSVFTSRAQRDPDCMAAMEELISTHGDPFTLLNAYRGWLEEKSSCDRKLSSSRWCRQRGLEEQRFYEMTKLRHQFTTLLQQSKLHESPTSENSGRCRTAAERAKRYGELQQLRALQREASKQNTRKAKFLRVDLDGGAAMSDEETNGSFDPKHLDFSIKNDSKQLSSLLQHSDVKSFRDVIMLKVVLSSGLYPNIAIADLHNNYKPGSEQFFHTPNKPFVALHPTSVFGRQPELLELSDADIVDLPDFPRSCPAATKHQMVLYVSLLETNKAFLMNTFRVPTAQTLLMFSQNIDTNADMSTIVCDSFIEMQFPDAAAAQNIIITSVKLRQLWNKLLDLKLQLTEELEEIDVLEVIAESSKLERELSNGLVELYLQEPLHSQKRLLAADLKVLHKGLGFDDAVLDPNPFTGGACVSHSSKGGVRLTEWLTYNCLFDTVCSATTISAIETVCPVCDTSLNCRVLERLKHVTDCSAAAGHRFRGAPSEEDRSSRDPGSQEYWCEDCQETLWLPIKQIFEHKKSHMPSESKN